MLKEAAEKHA